MTPESLGTSTSAVSAPAVSEMLASPQLRELGWHASRRLAETRARRACVASRARQDQGERGARRELEAVV